MTFAYEVYLTMKIKQIMVSQQTGRQRIRLWIVVINRYIRSSVHLYEAVYSLSS